MHVHECQANAVRIFLRTLRELPDSRSLSWSGRIYDRARSLRFARYCSEFVIAASNGRETREIYVALFDDGKCLHDCKSLASAFQAAVSETAQTLEAA
ncbi:MAG: hypothetical protein DLM50_03195 [Candidatus Meridianibacter frigidus]|nr:MAG: hypothetical protein DLM50_03195 [Candidatus Eremiobacteraeota bacterium]